MAYTSSQIEHQNVKEKIKAVVNMEQKLTAKHYWLGGGGLNCNSYTYLGMST